MTNPAWAGSISFTMAALMHLLGRQGTSFVCRAGCAFLSETDPASERRRTCLCQVGQPPCVAVDRSPAGRQFSRKTSPVIRAAALSGCVWLGDERGRAWRRTLRPESTRQNLMASFDGIEHHDLTTSSCSSRAAATGSHAQVQREGAGSARLRSEAPLRRSPRQPCAS
jgi:hypothetical protein